MSALDLTTNTPRVPRVRPLTGRDWRTPLLLLLLSAVPAIAGGARLGDVAGGVASAENARFIAAPFPIVLHIVTATLYAMLGAFQLSAGFRRRFPRAHRVGGRVLFLAGVTTALTGVWMANAYTIPAGAAGQGPLLLVTRNLVGVAMLASLVLGVVRILRRDVPGHEAWMIRAYALGQGAGTQVVIAGGFMAAGGDSVGLARDVLLTASWLVNVIVGEWIIRRAAGRRSGASGLVSRSARTPAITALEAERAR